MNAKIKISFTKNSKVKADTAVVFVNENKKLQPAGEAIDKKSGGLLSAAMAARGNFKAKHGEVICVFLPKSTGYKQALLVNLGDTRQLDIFAFENLGGKIAASLKNISPDNVALFFEIETEDKANAAAALGSGIRLRTYSFDKYKSSTSKGKTGDNLDSELKEITIILNEASVANKAYASHEAVSESVLFARDLVNEAPNILYSRKLWRHLSRKN